MPLLCLSSVSALQPARSWCWCSAPFSERSWLCKGRICGLGACWADTSRLRLRWAREQQQHRFPENSSSCHHIYSWVVILSYSEVCCPQLLTNQASSFCFSSFLPPPTLFPSCLLLRFILDKHTHLNIMVTISTSKHRISSLSYGLLILCYIMVN